MSVKVGENGLRSVQVEVEVPGSPEEVWQAIATGPGISSWFVPAKIEERVGGEISLCFGPGMDTVSTMAEWDPPRRFVANSEGMSPGAPAVADEWTVEAKSGGTCVVRVVHSWFASTDEWDGQFEAIEQGWGTFFQILRLVLTRFPGQPSASFEASAVAPGPISSTWEKFAGPLGVANATVGQQVSAGSDAPSFSGEVATMGPEDAPGSLVLVREPAQGICNLFAMPMGDQVYLSIRFYLFGEGADTAAAEAEPEWARWLADLFPSAE
ncbi:SRPBCC family protein [Fimbriimonas ginsengisoli]|uniref:Activator of Hsp90 ATPase 1 family protein n=1 Tax=Fimbriimonas ginsengisoli Gsoil 348 TaxID=661478 RepID=A0A068NY71_FIMGI|nr:SRPBCC domain-containing protein [Fimbriimonas ginsengisoli]AIE86699.1 Activator of Hsp90 ATPase 1 family protein [Fimbriimonas ginsengisoli Gsoil 348]